VPYVLILFLFLFLLLKIELWNFDSVSSPAHRGIIVCLSKYFVFLYDILRPRKEVPCGEGISARKTCPYFPFPLQPHVKQSNPLVPSENHVVITTNILVNRNIRRDD
jgi:hypothetical protein